MSAVVTFDIANLTHILWILLLVFTANCIEPQIDNNHIYKVVQKAITVNADTSDWQNIKAEKVNLKDHLWIGQDLRSENWQGPADLSYKWRAAYNKSKLYFLFEVADDTIGPFNRTNTWLNDCIELCIDPMNEGGIRKDTIDGKIKLYGYEMHFLPSATPHAFLRDDQSLYFTAQPQDYEFKNKWQGEIATRYTSSGYIMEIAISISEVILQKGTVIGFETAICDDDGNSRINLMTWTGIQTDYWISMTNYGKLIIE